MKQRKTILLASGSLRRQYLMKAMGFTISVTATDTDETYPSSLPVNDVPKYLALKKAASVTLLPSDTVLITADTVVIYENDVLNKPQDRNEAISMLTRLSGNTHSVVTGVCIRYNGHEEILVETSAVTFNSLSPQQIHDYIDRFNPYDKAGAYGAQDCLPSGMNPCSEAERIFLNKIGRPGLIYESMTPSDSGITIIKKIEGSYFNVMGLPIHRVYGHLALLMGDLGN